DKSPTGESGDKSPHSKLVLLTNARGGMARLCVDFGSITSKYDCLLGANLHPSLPVDRHVFVKRARVWLVADGFVSPLNVENLVAFEPGPPARWTFVASAGDGRSVEIELTAEMLPDQNTTVLRISRPLRGPSIGANLPAEARVNLTVRLDIEDRNFHWETKRNSGAEHHFNSNTRAISIPRSSRPEEARSEIRNPKSDIRTPQSLLPSAASGAADGRRLCGVRMSDFGFRISERASSGRLLRGIEIARVFELK